MSVTEIPRYGFFRYPNNATGLSAQTSFSLAAGFGALAGTPTLEVIPVAPGQGFTLLFGGAGADNDTIDYRIYLAERTFGKGVPAPTEGVTGRYLGYYGGGTATLSTGLTMGGSSPSPALRIADTLTFTLGTESTTPDGIGTAIDTAFGSPGPQVYNPAANVDPAMLIVPHIGWFGGFILDFDLTGTSTGAFALVKLH